ncbi:MAG: glycosyltransferase, partial [Myxococcota bacterium]
RELRSVPLAVVANGDASTEAAFDALSQARRGSVSRMRFNQELSELARAGADFMVMPSSYEPCGLPQLESPRFGTLPIVRATGGLADTVSELDGERGNGFVFEEESSQALGDAVERAMAFYGRSDRLVTLSRIMRESMERFSLKTTTESYMAIYRELLSGGGLVAAG